MKKQELISLLEGLGVHPSRKLGQNFLLDENLLRATVAAAAPSPGELIIEIGAGTGALTRHLLASGARVVAVEYDLRLFEYLRTALGDHDRLSLVQGDACRLDYDALSEGADVYLVVGNLPYAISSPVIAKLADAARRPNRMIVMIQREMGARLAAQPRTKDYGALSVGVQALYTVKRLRSAPPRVFWPPPRVQSVVMHLGLKDELPPPAVYRMLRDCTRQAFAQRRKKLLNALRPLAEPERLREMLAALELGERVRAEELSVEQFTALARMLLGDGA